MTTSNAQKTYTMELTWDEMVEIRVALNARSSMLQEAMQDPGNDENYEGYSQQKAKASALWTKFFQFMKEKGL